MVAVLALGTERPANAQTLDDAVGAIAKSVCGYMRDRNHTRVTVLGFNSDNRVNLGVEDSLRRHLDAEIETINKTLPEAQQLARSTGGLTISGECWVEALDDSGEKFQVKITAKLRTKFVEVRDYVQHAIEAQKSDPASLVQIEKDGNAAVVRSDAAESVAAVAGINAVLTKATDTPANVQANQELRLVSAIKEPKVQVDPLKHVVEPEPNSPYKLDVRIFDNATQSYRPLPMTLEDGQPRCELVPGQMYAVTLYNDAPYDCAVRLTIDGINTFNYSEIPHYRDLGMWIVPSGRTGFVRGFHKDNERDQFGTLEFVYYGFLVSDLPDEALQEACRKTSNGLITATFYPAWQGAQIPQIAMAGRGTPGTVPGDTVKSSGSEGEYKIDDTTPLATIAVRYTADTNKQPSDLP